MSVYRVTLYVNDRGRGDSESYLTPDVSDSSQHQGIRNLILERSELFAPEVSFDGVRIALYGATRRSQLLVPGKDSDIWQVSGKSMNLPFTGAGPTPTVALPYAAWGQSLQQTFGFDNTRKTVRYLCGIPRDIVANPAGQTQINAENDWWTRLEIFDAFLRTGFQLEALIQPTSIASYRVISVGSTTGITDIWVGVGFPTWPGTLTVGSKLHLYNFRPAKGTRSPTLNGVWFCSGFDSASTPGTLKIYLRNSSAVIPALQRFTDKTYVLDDHKQPFPIQAIFPGRVVTRKRGKASLVPRGRRLTRYTLDP